MKPALEGILQPCLLRDDVEGVERILGGRHNDIDADSGVSVLAMAAAAGAGRVVEALLLEGAPPQVGGVVSPLHEAVKGRHRAVVEILLRAGADPDESDEDDEETALSLACSFEEWEIAEVLVKAGAVRCDPQGVVKLHTSGPLSLAGIVAETVATAAPQRVADYLRAFAGQEREAGGPSTPERARQMKATRVLLEGLLPRYQRWVRFEELAVAGRKDELRRALENLGDEERVEARTAAIVAAIVAGRWDVYQDLFADGVDVGAVGSMAGPS